MSTIVAIVEGHGEVAALPILLRRLSGWFAPKVPVHISAPIRVRKDRFLNNGDEFNRMLQLAANKCGNDGWILVLLDADDDCPKELGRLIRDRAALVVPNQRLATVIANREFEAWFLAAATSLARHLGVELRDIPDPELPRNAKGWVQQNLMRGSYGETTDQARLAAVMDLEEAHCRSRSFRKLCSEFKVNVSSEPQ